MFESRTYEALLSSALSRVASPVDKREGSMVMNGVAPSMAELAQLYIAADFVLQATYIITAPREYLIKRAHDRNMDPYERLKDNGKPHFPKSQAFHLCAELQSCALRILRGCVAANGRYFETEYEERLKDLDGVLIECETMGQLINLSFKRKYITGDQCHYWAELVRPVRQKAFNWRKSDGNRAATLREAKTAQELAKMGQMALQMAEALRPQ